MHKFCRVNNFASSSQNFTSAWTYSSGSLSTGKNWYASLRICPSLVKKSTCKQNISLVLFFGTRTIFTQAMPKTFCRENWPVLTFSVIIFWTDLGSSWLLRNTGQ